MNGRRWVEFVLVLLFCLPCCCLGAQVFARAIKVFTRNFFFVSRQLLFFQWTTRQWQYESCNKGSISITRIKSTKIGVKETERNKACTHLIRKNSYELVRFLWSYKVHTSEFAICSDRFKVGVNNKSICPFWSNPLLKTSKLILC